MSANTAIEWCDSTFNPWIGCTKVSPACDHCYAEALMDHRMHKAQWGAGNPRVRTSAANWHKPVAWNKKPFFECECGWRGEGIIEHGLACNWPSEKSYIQVRRRVFCASLADVFDNEVPIAWLAELLDLVRLTPGLDWLLLTKRVGNVIQRLKHVRDFWSALGLPDIFPWISEWIDGHAPANVWIGSTICNQEEANRDIPKLITIPARVRFVSIEPMLGPIDFSGMWVEFKNPAIHQNMLELIDWVIVGGESGQHARPMHPRWVHVLRDQCIDVGVPFLFKQWGEYAPNHRTIHELKNSSDKPKTVPYSTTSLYPAAIMDRVGKKTAGRQLDGIEWNQFPEVRA